MNPRRLALLLTAVFFLQYAGAQSLPNTLLWRIEKAGHHTSYLYGTMHLTDQRVFDLGDSLYAAIRNTDGLATELDVSVLFNLAVQEIEHEMQNDKSVKDLLSEEDYKNYGPLLAKKLKKPLSAITASDIVNAKNRWMRDKYSKGDISTFLDMYLYEAARRERKWTGGVEDLEDQRGLADALQVVDKSDIVNLVADGEAGAATNELEKMIAVYVKQDLAAIDTIFSNTPDRETVLDKRNQKMARRMDSLSGVRSMVFAVGVAHLPGEQGLIKLLRARGFDVEPVFSSHTIKAKDYKLPDLPQVWDTVSDENGFYRAAMPGKAQDLDLYHLVKMKMYFDFFDMNAYCAAAIPSAYSASRMDSLMDELAGRVFENEKKTFVNLTVHGARGRAYTNVGGENFKKGYFLYKDGILYMAYGIAIRGSETNKGKIDRFLKSFELLDRKKADPDLAKMSVHRDTAYAYSVATPTEAQLNSNTRTALGHAQLYISTDPDDGGYYFFGINETSPDRFVLDDSSFFRNLVESVSPKVKKIDFDTSWIENDQRVTEIRGQMKEVDMIMNIRYFDRGSRWYVLLAMYPVGGSTANRDRFFASFSELDYPAHGWMNAVSPDSAFGTWAPGAIVTLPADSSDDADIDHKFVSYDSSRAESFSVVSYHLDPYYWSNSDSAFWASRIAAHITYADTLLSKKPVTNGGVKGWEWVQRNNTGHNYERFRLLLDGDQLYSLILCAPHKELFTDNANKFFENFRFSQKPPPTTYLESKAQRLIADLLSPDSTIYFKAERSFSSATFGKKDLPLLHQSLLRVAHRKGDEDHAFYLCRQITEAITGLKDTSSFRFAAEHYREIPDSEAVIKNALLTLLVQVEDSFHFREMARLVVASPPSRPIDYFIRQHLRDSMTLTAIIAPQLLPLLKDTISMAGFSTIMVKLLDSGRLSKDRLAPYHDALLQYSGRVARRLSTDKNATGDFEDDILELCARFNESRDNAMIRQFLRCADKDLALTAARLLIRNKQPIDSAALRPLAADQAYRHDLYKALKDSGRVRLFPAAYRTQKAFGQSVVYDRATDNEDLEGEGMTISYVTSRTLTATGGKKRLLFYTLKSGEKTWLACAGPYGPDPTQVDPANAYASIYYEAEFDKSLLEAQIKALTTQFQADAGPADDQ